MSAGALRPFIGGLVSAAILAAAWFNWTFRSGPPGKIVSIKSGGYTLEGSLYLPENPRAAIVFFHGNRKNGRGHALYRWLIRDLSRHHAVLAVDFRGYGKSSPLPRYHDRFEWDFHEDVEAAAGFLARQTMKDLEEIVLMGHSFGSLQVINASKYLPSRTVVALGPSNFERVRDDAKALAQHLKKTFRNTGVDVPPDQFSRSFAYWAADRLYKDLKASRVLFVYGSEEPADQRVDAVPNALDALPPDLVTVKEIAGADHMYLTESRSFVDRELRSRWLVRKLARHLDDELGRISRP